MGAEEVSKKSDFSGRGNLIQLSVVPNEASGDIFESGFLYTLLPWFVFHKTVKLTDRLAAAEGLFLLTAKETKPKPIG